MNRADAVALLVGTVLFVVIVFGFGRWFITL